MVKAKGDKDNPRSKGYVCRKGLNVINHQYPADRLTEPLKRVDGDFQSIAWDQAMTEIVRLYGEDEGRPDELTLARIDREREEASQRLAKTRDVAAWQATMARLDAEQQVARQPRQQQRMAPEEVADVLGIPRQTVYSRLRRAEASLHSILQADDRSPATPAPRQEVVR